MHAQTVSTRPLLREGSGNEASMCNAEKLMKIVQRYPRKDLQVLSRVKELLCTFVGVKLCWKSTC